MIIVDYRRRTRVILVLVESIFVWITLNEYKKYMLTLYVFKLKSILSKFSIKTPQEHENTYGKKFTK